jgi:hypothetical protein
MSNWTQTVKAHTSVLPDWHHNHLITKKESSNTILLTAYLTTLKPTDKSLKFWYVFWCFLYSDLKHCNITKTKEQLNGMTDF